jgi:hypothetical protein
VNKKNETANTKNESEESDQGAGEVLVSDDLAGCLLHPTSQKNRCEDLAQPSVGHPVALVLRLESAQEGQEGAYLLEAVRRDACPKEIPILLYPLRRIHERYEVRTTKGSVSLHSTKRQRMLEQTYRRLPRRTAPV